eukprot:8379301-Karenia_brevis.AAC.1
MLPRYLLQPSDAYVERSNLEWVKQPIGVKGMLAHCRLRAGLDMLQGLRVMYLWGFLSNPIY